ncbi:hypothetical protein HS088_TW06G00231 [Tripterygium wilfordii]|uniref:Uncharacterized protein n=1 Tax=Tripterygium wilfordii TaxID=458696 RepID=A0A7J7DJ26_TRIWF|nr:hypothetical protein HS088_TW06G00231 [Tripterygium wilfordii]
MIDKGKLMSIGIIDLIAVGRRYRGVRGPRSFNIAIKITSDTDRALIDCYTLHPQAPLDRLAKLNDKSKEMKHKMRSLSDGMAEASAEFRNLRKPTGPVDKLEKMWLRGHVRYYLDCKIKFMDEFLKLNRQMSRTELGIAKECAGYEKLREDYMLSVARLFGFGFLNVVMVGLFYKAGRLLKPADVST